MYLPSNGAPSPSIATADPGPQLRVAARDALELSERAADLVGEASAAASTSAWVRYGTSVAT